MKQSDLPAKEPVVLYTTEKRIGSTVYIVESIQSENAKESVSKKLQRLMLSHISDVGKNCKSR